MQGVKWLCGVWMTAAVMAAALPAGAQESFVSTTREQITLTIYDQNFALVSERRPLTLKQGRNEVVLLDISPMLDTQSLWLQWVGRPAPAEILAHTYDMGVQDGDSLLRRYLGKQVELLQYGSDGRVIGVLEGRLISMDANRLILEASPLSTIASAVPQLPRRAIYVNPQGTLRLPVEADMPLIPALRLQVQAPNEGNAALTVSYLTGGLDWDADYIAVLRGENALKLECWATVTNQTGLTFPNARVSLATGVAPPESVQVAFGRAESFEWRDRPAVGAIARRIVPQPLGEVYTYPLAQPVSIQDARQSRLLLHEAPQVPVQKRYIYRAPSLWANAAPGIGKEVRRDKAEVSLVLENRKEHGLGIPLPNGSVRLYETDSNGTPRYLGTASLSATPVNQKITLQVGQAFDITGEWQPLRQKVLGRGKVEYEVQITLRNAKSQPVQVLVVQPFGGGWTILNSTQPYTRASATAAQWTLKVPAGGATSVRFTVRVQSAQ